MTCSFRPATSSQIRERADVRHIAGQRRDIGHAGVHVHGADRVPAGHGVGLVNDLLVSLHVAIPGALLFALRAALIEHELREV